MGQFSSRPASRPPAPRKKSAPANCRRSSVDRGHPERAVDEASQGTNNGSDTIATPNPKHKIDDTIASLKKRQKTASSTAIANATVVAERHALDLALDLAAANREKPAADASSGLAQTRTGEAYTDLDALDWDARDEDDQAVADTPLTDTAPTTTSPCSCPCHAPAAAMGAGRPGVASSDADTHYVCDRCWVDAYTAVLGGCSYGTAGKARGPVCAAYLRSCGKDPTMPVWEVDNYARPRVPVA
ncbi:hypothetical protein GGR52DRAFT_587555 [Hypoxylon sp. FL1284]|nr:hypothetical protein GGR52DRAFT_587555 [Hypoxylon sp. FL1284]